MMEGGLWGRVVKVFKGGGVGKGQKWEVWNMGMRAGFLKEGRLLGGWDLKFKRTGWQGGVKGRKIVQV